MNILNKNSTNKKKRPIEIKFKLPIAHQLQATSQNWGMYGSSM